MFSALQVADGTMAIQAVIEDISDLKFDATEVISHASPIRQCEKVLRSPMSMKWKKTKYIKNILLISGRIWVTGHNNRPTNISVRAILLP